MCCNIVMVCGCLWWYCGSCDVLCKVLFMWLWLYCYVEIWWLYCCIVVVCGIMWWLCGGEVLCSHSPSKNNNFHTTTFSKIFFIPLAEQMFAQTNVPTTLLHLYTKTLQIIQKDVIKMSI